MDALGCEQVLDAERNAFQRSALPLASRASDAVAIARALSGVSTM